MPKIYKYLWKKKQMTKSKLTKWLNKFKKYSANFKNNQVIEWEIELLIKTTQDKEFTLKYTVLNIFKFLKTKKKQQIFSDIVLFLKKKINI